MMISGGFSVLNDSVLSPLQFPELVEIDENLESARRKLTGLKTNNQSRWLNFFMNSGRNFEHEDFLSLWLSRFVFPGKIGSPIFSIVVNLARDMIISGGFSVLSDSVLFPLQFPELVEIDENLESARRKLFGLKTNNQSRWLNFFMNSGRNFEHEAFLSLWLSRFVLPGKIGSPVFSIVVNLAKGMLLALITYLLLN
uniref:Aminotransferase-like plant mobile domain-containing protein n=1 Tax=Solanum tuberosum TaxID=4113 RepID=M1DF35_SOLTU